MHVDDVSYTVFINEKWKIMLLFPILCIPTHDYAHVILTSADGSSQDVMKTEGACAPS